MCNNLNTKGFEKTRRLDSVERIFRPEILFLFLSFLLTGVSCEDTPVEIIPVVQLSAEEVGVTELWLRVSMNESTEVFSVKRNDSLLVTLHPPIDTILYDDGLLPKHTYTYTAGRTSLAVTTMDTTSHDFTFTQHILGEGQNSIIRDVAIVNDSNIYVVGQMYKKDSTGAWIDTLYNVGLWDGRSWKLKSVPMSSYNFDCTFVDDTPPPLSSAFVFSSGKVIICNSGNVASLNDTGTTDYPCLPMDMRNGPITKLWGTDENNIYCVGYNGTIVHYQNGIWSKMESGTNVDLLDVWGTPDGSTVWACGYEDSNFPTVLLRCMNNTWQEAFDGTQYRTKIRYDSLSGWLSSVYVPSSRRVLVASNYGAYSCLLQTKGEAKRLSFAPKYFPGFPTCVRGNGENDFMIVGYFTMIAHYNGFSWRYWDEFRDENKQLLSVAFRQNTFVAVGYDYDPIHSKGLIIICKR